VVLSFPISRAEAAVWTDTYMASNGYANAGDGVTKVSTITFDDWGYQHVDPITGAVRGAKDYAPINGFDAGNIGQKQHVVTLKPDYLTPDSPSDIKGDLTNTPTYTNANMDGGVNFFKWGYTSPGYDRQSDYSAYKAGDYSASSSIGSQFNNMQIDHNGDYLVPKSDMHFGYYDSFAYRDTTGVNPDQDVATKLQFQPYAVSDAIGWCGSVMASHPNAVEPMAGQLQFDFAFDVYFASNGAYSSTQIAPGFEMRSYGTLDVNVWNGTELQSFSSNAVINNTNPLTGDVDPAYANLVSFHGAGVLPDGVWVSADSFNPDGSRKLNPDGTWDVTVVPEGTPGAIWHANAFAGYAWILRADGIRMLDWFDPAYGPDPQAVPEPGSLVLLASGLIGMIGFARKRG